MFFLKCVLDSHNTLHPPPPPPPPSRTSTSPPLIPRHHRPTLFLGCFQMPEMLELHHGPFEPVEGNQPRQSRAGLQMARDLSPETVPSVAQAMLPPGTKNNTCMCASRLLAAALPCQVASSFHTSCRVYPPPTPWPLSPQPPPTHPTPLSPTPWRVLLIPGVCSSMSVKDSRLPSPPVWNFATFFSSRFYLPQGNSECDSPG